MKPASGHAGIGAPSSHRAIARDAEVSGNGLIIVGNGRRAMVAYECFSNDSPYLVAAFSAEAQYIEADACCGLPLVPLEDLAVSHPPERYLAFIAVAPSHGNHARRRLYEVVKSVGYTCASYISSRAFSLQNVRVGENVFVSDYAALQHMVRVGNNVFVGSGTCVGHSTVVEDDCFIGQHAVVAGFCNVGRGCYLGSNSCVADVVRVADECVLNPGAVVLKDTKPGQVYNGNPARPAGRAAIHSS
jgi:sugar O-acyltransferase (sialic acid O-acetyltransferase NeuD family)